jgi:hypothetical protein
MDPFHFLQSSSVCEGPWSRKAGVLQSLSPQAIDPDICGSSCHAILIALKVTVVLYCNSFVDRKMLGG